MMTIRPAEARGETELEIEGVDGGELLVFDLA